MAARRIAGRVQEGAGTYFFCPAGGKIPEIFQPSQESEDRRSRGKRSIERITPAQWRAAETGLAAVTGQMLALLPAISNSGAPRSLTQATVTSPRYSLNRARAAHSSSRRCRGRQSYKAARMIGWRNA